MKLKLRLMHTPKILKALILLIVGLGLCSIFLLSRNYNAKAQKALKKPASELTNPAGPEFDYSGLAYGHAIQNAQTYLIRNYDSIIPDYRLILDYLQRKYGINPQFSAQNSPISPRDKGTAQNPAQLNAFKRIAYPNELVSTLPAVTNDPMTQMMMAAMQCDHIPLSPGFGDLVGANLKSGGYNLTHVEFSLQRLKENHCQYFAADQEKTILDNTSAGMVKLVQASDTTPDLRYESAAFLLDMGRSDLVQPAWIQQVIADQQSDGSWETPSTRNNGADNHATIVGLWVLLAYSRPDAPDEPMLHHYPK